MTIKELLEQLRMVAVDAAVDVAKGFGAPAAKDAVEFIGHAGEDLARYATLRMKSEISESELGDLVRGKGALATMKALTIAGLAQIEIEKTKQAILNAVTAAIGTAAKGLTA
jgi:hypothetical protein